MTQETQPPPPEAVDSESPPADQQAPLPKTSSNRNLLIVIGIGCVIVLGICVLLALLGLVGWVSVAEVLTDDHDITSSAPVVAAASALNTVWRNDDLFTS